VDFERHVLSGWAEYHFSALLGDTLRLDTRGIELDRIKPLKAPTRRVEWSLGEADYLGRMLTIAGTKGLDSLVIHFRTSPDAPALQWLDPEQTAGGKHPYLYSQCQPILARSVFPCQDTPAVRFTYDAALHIPRELSAVMAAAGLGTESENGKKICRFHMRHPVPSYLFALAVGNIARERIGARSEVFAEPEIIKAAAWEFAEVDRMIEGAEQLFGRYIWDRFDLLVMPPSFPLGGMENPTLTFLTPTLLAGDRSLVNVVTHELAHSWTGNLVTNATWEDFWLNEGWTVYAERRILEHLHGTEFANLQAVNGGNDLLDAIRNFGDKQEYTKLKPDLGGLDPDDVYSSVPYEKGFLLLVEIERVVGREVFDRFIRSYIADFQFTSITTSQFVEYLTKRLPEVAATVNLDRWICEPGLPDSAPVFTSHLIDEVRDARRRWDGGDRNLDATVRAFSVDQKVLFLEELPRQQSIEDCRHIERTFDIAAARNCEILLPWYCIAAASGYEPVYGAIRELLGSVGRGKYLKPLYRALHGNPATRAMARELFERFAHRYHSVARAAVQRILAT
jgi:leukotriene-A4 hydrolase